MTFSSGPPKIIELHDRERAVADAAPKWSAANDVVLDDDFVQILTSEGLGLSPNIDFRPLPIFPFRGGYPSGGAQTGRTVWADPDGKGTVVGRDHSVAIV